ncbi:tryptophan synthase subunit alpha [Aneurinibacillus terranovensis]|uniref:tryptophan synthase subunit alpha n=1 Tax=Aneurinibacillus terranovensis TaxID=278991 RepID=UPI0003F7F0F6|nr:tryptophan synthase subunit alpha [Aneurinibacillus terranovensis]
MITSTGGTKRIEGAFAKGRQAFIPFITAGFPTPETTLSLGLALQEAGADLLELGVPYSDPLADGPTIQFASAQALTHGVTIQRVIELAGAMREKGVTIPIILFTYYNPVLRYGIDRLFEEMAAADIDGILIPDLPFEEAEEVEEIAARYGRPLISLVAPTSQKRIQMIASRARGFLYCVSSLGVTGTRKELGEHIVPFLEEVKRYSGVPVAVGFGISSREQAERLAPYSDGFIVGSALIEKIRELSPRLIAPDSLEEALNDVKIFVKQLHSAV